VGGEVGNITITTPAELFVAEKLLAIRSLE
jgi:hypothetical protein